MLKVFFQIILLIIGVKIMAKIFNWIKNILNFHTKTLEKFETLQQEHNQIESYLKNSNQEIKEILSEDSHIRKDITYIKDTLKEEQMKKESLSNKELDIAKTIENINTFNKNYLDLKLELQELKIDNKLLNKKIEDLQKENTYLKEILSKKVSINEKIQEKQSQLKNTTSQEKQNKKITKNIRK